MPPRIALVSCAEFRSIDEDLPPLFAALSSRGAEPAVVDWEDPAADWASFDVAVVRSPWDYTHQHEEFLAWTDRCGARTRLLNEPAVIRWNCDKRYLGQLAALGVAVVDTAFVSTAAAIEPALSAATAGGTDVVVKPAISAGSRNTARYRPDQLAGAAVHASSLLDGGHTVMVQPYQRAVDDEGETALLFFGGELSHAVCKLALLVVGEEARPALFTDEQLRAVQPDAAQLAVAESCLGALASIDELAGVGLPLPYARVDVLRDNSGRWSLLELELMEPSLFLAWGEGAAGRFADEILGSIT